MQTAFEFLSQMTPDRFVRTFWVLIFVEIPRFLITDIVALWYILFVRKPVSGVVPHGVTAIIPAHNAGAEVIRTVLALREQSYSPIRIIVVNDGSDDETDDLCRPLERDGTIDTYIHLEVRGGKSAAVNAALAHTETPLFLVTDADTTFDRDAIAQAAVHFTDPDTGVVGGTLRVRNAEDNLVTLVQSINYAVSILLGRISRDILGFFFVASGAFGMYRTQAVRAVGGWDFGPGEDGDIMTRLRLAGWGARFEPLAVARTDVPTTMADLIGQRLRWNRSLIRNRFRKSRAVTLNPAFANFSPMFAMSYLDMYYFSAAVPFLYIVYVADMFSQFGMFAFQILLIVTIVYMPFSLVQFILASAVSVEHARDLRHLVYVPLYSVVNLYILRMVRLYAVASELIFRQSYDDPYVPEKVRQVAERY